MTKQRLILVGNGMAGIRTLEKVLARVPDHYGITVFGAEPHLNYNRIMLSPVLAGEKTFDQIILNGHDWYEKHGIALHAGDKVVGVDRAARTVTSASGLTLGYDKLLLATGSSPVVLPVPGRDLPGVVGFRDLSDVEAMVAAARTGTHAVVIGGGLLGLEAANGLALHGMDVTVLHLMPTLMERQLDEAGGEDIVFRDAARGVHKRVILRDNRVAGAVLYGDTRDGPWYFQLLRDGEDISALRDTLIFGQGVGAVASDPFAAVAALADTAEVCGCNGVRKGAIVAAIREKGCCSIDDVRTHTKASASCGGCTGLVEKLLAHALGDSYKTESGAKPVCKCTTLTHGDVRRLIKVELLKSIAAIMQRLEWSTAEGCASCRPALNYYLLAAWPGEYKDDQQSRFVNERLHANIQKDGTFSVVPRMWGGLTTPAEPRAIADVAEKFAIPTVKVTGGQRIDLLGVKKEDLRAVWTDLNAAGMVSGHAYGKSLRTVKTCVGSEWCRFGTQASMAMGVKLEKMCWGSWTPHKVKLAVSGCPRNCAEATIKDFGVIAVDSGWELHVGGNGGLVVRACHLLCKVETEAEVMEYCGAFLQLYREEAHYLERTAPWVERVTMDYVRARIVLDPEHRELPHHRFLLSQKYEQIDPWAERAAHGVDAHEFAPLARIG